MKENGKIKEYNRKNYNCYLDLTLNNYYLFVRDNEVTIKKYNDIGIIINLNSYKKLFSLQYLILKKDKIGT